MARLSKEEADLIVQKLGIAKTLQKKLFDWLRDLWANKIGIEKYPESKEGIRKITARTHLIIAGQLSGQIIISLSSSSLLIALIGLRSLTECLINAKYIFHHPKHIGDIGWTDKMCADLLDRSNDKDALKSRLGEETIKDRAKNISSSDFDALELYNNTFGYLSNYTHSNHRAIMINDNKIFGDMTYMTMHHAICLAHDVGDAICEYFRLDKNSDLENEIIKFRDECLTLAGQGLSNKRPIV